MAQYDHIVPPECGGSPPASVVLGHASALRSHRRQSRYHQPPQRDGIFVIQERLRAEPDSLIRNDPRRGLVDQLAEILLKKSSPPSGPIF
jgi:hypothetical protein